MQDQGRDFYVTSIGFTCCLLSPLPFHFSSGENAERNSQMLQVVGSVLEVANQAHDTKARVKWCYAAYEIMHLCGLKPGARFSNAVSWTPIYDRHMHSHAHTRNTSTHCLGDQRIIPTHQSVVLGEKVQKSAKEFSQPRAAADLVKQELLHILIKVSTVQWTLWPPLFTLLLTCCGFICTGLKCQHPFTPFLSI